MSISEKGRKLSGWQKMAVDFGPLVLFFIGYFMPDRIGPVVDSVFATDFFSADGHELYLALVLFMPAYVIAFLASLAIERRIAPMLLVNGIIAIGLGGLTLLSGNKTLFYMKPTVIYALFSIVLAGGLLSGRNFLKLLFDDAFHMPESAWRTLTWRFAGAFVFMALANEIAWRTLTAGCVPDAECGGEATWVNVKLFGFTGAYILFILTQGPFIAKHMRDPKTGKKVIDGPDDTVGVVNTDNQDTPAEDRVADDRAGSNAAGADAPQESDGPTNTRQG